MNKRDNPEVNWPVVADQQVKALRSAIRSGAQDLDVIPKLLKSLLKEDLWRHRFVEQLQREVTFERFGEFVSEKAPEGLGSSVETLKKFCQSAGDLEAVDLIDQASAGKQGKKLNNVKDMAPEGNASTRALRTLRAKRPDLHAQVLAGRKTPHGAMVEAGLRVKTHSIPHDPEKAAHALRRLFNRIELAELERHLHRLREEALDEALAACRARTGGMTEEEIEEALDEALDDT